MRLYKRLVYKIAALCAICLAAFTLTQCGVVNKLDFTIQQAEINPASLTLRTDGLEYLYASSILENGNHMVFMRDPANGITYRVSQNGEEIVTAQDRFAVYKPEIAPTAYQAIPFNGSFWINDFFIDESGQSRFNLIADRQVIVSDYCDKMPYITVINAAGSNNISEERIILNYDTNGKSYLIDVTYPPNQNMIAASSYRYYPEQNLEQGKRIVFCGGVGDYIYYQQLQMGAGDPHPDVYTFETHGQPTIYRYKISDGTTEKIADLPVKLMHLNGNSNALLVSEYDYFAPLEASGKIMSVADTSKTFTLPGVSSGANIQQSLFLNDTQLIFNTPVTLFFVDFKSKIIKTLDISMYNNIHLSNKRVTFTSGIDPITVYQFNPENVF
ncbi:MAG: hypothetical protein LBL96_03640 [Clostridiales bacterium]|jgi:hypothetical protein|nr:hypothetical protein [Clostridiales bacterium]